MRLNIPLKNVILDGGLNRFKDPLLVLTDVLEPVSRRPKTGSRSQNQPNTRRQVVQIHVKERLHELEQLYLDTFSSSSTIASPAQRHTVSCSRSECSLTFHYRKDETNNKQRTLMARFQHIGALDAIIGGLRTYGVEVEGNPMESQESSGLPLQPRQQVLYVPVPVEFAHQHALYHGSPPPLISQASSERDLTRPTNRTPKGQSTEVVPQSQSGGHAQSVPKTRKQSSRGNESPTSQVPEKRRRSAKHLNKSTTMPGSEGHQPTKQAAITKLLENGNNVIPGLVSVGSTIDLTQLITPSPESTDASEDADKSSQSTMVMPPSMKSDDQLIQELMIAHDVLTEATKVWNKLKERGQTGTKEIEDLQEIQKMWVSLGEELVQHLHSRVVATVGELREARRQATGQ